MEPLQPNNGQEQPVQQPQYPTPEQRYDQEAPDAFEDDSEEYDYEDEVEETVADNDIMLNALIDLLIKKGVITEEEFDQSVEEFSDSDDDSEEDSEDSDDSEFC